MSVLMKQVSCTASVCAGQSVSGCVCVCACVCVCVCVCVWSSLLFASIHGFCPYHIDTRPLFPFSSLVLSSSAWNKQRDEREQAVLELLNVGKMGLFSDPDRLVKLAEDSKFYRVTQLVYEKRGQYVLNLLFLYLFFKFVSLILIVSLSLSVDKTGFIGPPFVQCVQLS